MPLFSHRIQHVSDEQLMDGIKRGDGVAFDELYSRYSTRLLHYFYRMLGGQEEKAQDFLQDLFVKLVEKPGLFSGPRFSTWIFTVAHNMCKNEYRRMNIRNAATPDVLMTLKTDMDDHVERHLDHQAFARALCNALNALKEEQRQVFLLRHQENFSIKEISEIVGCSEGTVKSRLFYTTKKLARRLRVFDPKLIER